MKTIADTAGKLRAFATGAGLYVAGAGFITLLGWVLGRPRLTDWINSGISAFPNAAICAVLSGIALWGVGRQSSPATRKIARVLATFVATIGTLTLSEHIFGINLGIDTLLFNRPWGQLASTAPMRMGPPASASFAVLGIALFLATCSPRKRRVASVMALFTAAVALMSLVGYWFGANQLFGIARLTGIAFQTTTMLAALSMGLVFSLPEFGVVAMIERQDAGGFLVRRLILPIIVFPLVLGWLRVLGQERGLFDTAFGTSVMALSTIVSLLVLLSWTARSITRQTEIAAEADQSVREQREWLRVTLSSIGDAVITTDTKGDVTFVNPVAAALTGWTEEEAVGLPLETVFHIVNEQTRQRVENPALRAMREGVIVGLANHTVLISKDGSGYPIDDSGSPIRDANGKTIGSVLIFRDITQRRLLEEERAASARVARRLAAIVESSEDAILATDFDLRVTSWNRAAERMFGYTAAETIGQSIYFIIPEDRRNEEDDIIARIRRGEKVEHFETERRHRDGTHIPVSLAVSPLYDATGTIVGASKIIRDIAERKRSAEAESKARRAAEEANRAKDEFLATVSHELRNPLSAILGWTTMLKQDHTPPERVTKALEVIERNARLEAQLVESLLDVSRIAAGKFPLDAQKIDLSILLQAIVDSYKPLADDKGIFLGLDVPSHPILVVGDSNRLQQIVSNLVTNAFKFTARGGDVRIRLIGIGSQAQIQVIDNGAGIPPEFLPHVFDRFRQAEGGKARSHGGLGLGLTIVRELVHAHGGTVTAESLGKGKGATFTVTLPIPAVIPAHIESANLQQPQEKPLISGLSVLVVDDDADARELIALVLQSHGALAQMATSAGEALTQVKLTPPDVIIADIGMPNEDGYVLIQNLRVLEHENSRQRLSAIALTAYAGTADRDQALRAGYDVHLRKPVTSTELIQTVAKFGRTKHNQV